MYYLILVDAKEYTAPLKQLENDCKIRTEVAGFLKRYKVGGSSS